MEKLMKKVDALLRLAAAENDEERNAAKEEIRGMVRQEKVRVTTQANVIEDTLMGLGIPGNILGFRYTAEAVRLVVENEGIISSVTGALYPAVGAKFRISPNKAERSIRHAVELSWERADPALLREYFVNTQKKPTNAQFIARVAALVRRAMAQ